jgi:hypothetical protein
VRVSLTVAGTDEACSKCGRNDTDTQVVKAVIIIDGHSGEAEPLCSGCMDAGSRADIPMSPLVTGPAPRRKALKKGKKTSLDQERDIAEEYGGRTQPGSGNQAGAKGDVRLRGQLRIEAKFTQAESYNLKFEDLCKIAGEATFGELPVLFIDFLAAGTRKLRDRFAVIHDVHFKELYGASKNRGPERPG